MLKILLYAGLIAATPFPQEKALNKITLPARRTFAHSTGEVNDPALLQSLHKTLNKYHSHFTNPRPSTNASLHRRQATENLIDQVDSPDFDEQYYGPVTIGSGPNAQGFTVQFDTGSADLFIPGPQCTSYQGCPLSTKYNQRGTFQGQTADVQYGSGYVEGDLYRDSVAVAGLTASNQGLISITEATGFDDSDSDGILGMGFTALSASGDTTFFENLMAQNQVAAPEFSFYLGRAASSTSTLSTLCLGCRDPTHYTGGLTTIPVTAPAYWQIVLNSITVSGVSAGPTTRGQAIIDTGTTLVLAPTAAARAIFALVPNSFAIPLEGGSDQTFFAYPCDTAEAEIPALRFGGRAFAINGLDFNFGVLTPEFARLVGDEALAERLLEQKQKMTTGPKNGSEGVVEGRATGDVQNCVAALVGSDATPSGNLFVVGDAFLKNWYSVFNYRDAEVGGRPSVSFAQAV